MRSIAKTASPPSLTTPTEPDVSRYRWQIDNLASGDGHSLNVSFGCVLHRVDEFAERKLFVEAFGKERAAQDAISAHFLNGLRGAAADLARGEPAEALLSLSAKSLWIKALQQSVNETGFMCGLAVQAPFEVEVTSPTVQRERLEQMQRIAAERRSADRVGHLARAAELLRQWVKLKADVPSITPGQLLEQVNPADRGMMLDTLLMAGGQGESATSPPDLWAVSGSQLVRVDLKTDSPQPRLFPLPTSVGPLRSIRADAGKLWIGARAGVMVADPADPANSGAATIYYHPALASDYGFTSVMHIGQQIWACHREGGLVSWQIGKTESPATILPLAQLGGEPKNLTSAGLFSVGNQLRHLAKNSPAITFDSPIVAILPVPGQVAVVTEGGAITLLDLPDLQKAGELQTSSRLSGASLLPWLSSVRLLLNRADGPIECIGLEDHLVTQFLADHTGMRAVIACAGKVAAMSSDRQRLLLWNAWEGRKTAGEVYLSGITRHRIADIAFG